MMTRGYSRWLAFGCACVLCGIAFIAAEETKKPESASAPAEQAGLGLAKESAIEVCGPKGERAYLDRLTCSDGAAVKYERSGSVGFRNDPKTKKDEKAVKAQMLGSAPIKPGEKDFHMIDGYDVQCGAGKTVLYLDMYHCTGFTFRGAGQPK